MTAMKLQKLTYYAQAWHLVFDGVPLFESKIEAWANGPVVRELYGMHRGRYSLAPGDLGGDPDALSPSERGTIEAVFSAYSHLDATQLSVLSHSEPPWADARAGLRDGQRGDVEIDTAALLEYFEKVHRQQLEGLL
ncbi:hypothetical protein BN970_03169 [Mycolicibacterium conceptionense]|nr:type II toxin-antitoxin system antitoxin SocA domain-containing protein [Mycolicibacterium conceptionense]CQD15216.1 hypothetical protein BN970_03169 [Mycolicibacterium conceptionense]